MVSHLEIKPKQPAVLFCAVAVLHKHRRWNHDLMKDTIIDNSACQINMINVRHRQRISRMLFFSWNELNPYYDRAHTANFNTFYFLAIPPVLFKISILLYTSYENSSFEKKPVKVWNMKSLATHISFIAIGMKFSPAIKNSTCYHCTKNH